MDEKTKKWVQDCAEVAHDMIVTGTDATVDGQPLTAEEIVSLNNVVQACAKLENEEERIRAEFREKTDADRKIEWGKIIIPAALGLGGTALTVGAGILVTKAVCGHNAWLASTILGVEETGVITSKAFNPLVRAMTLPKIF